MHTECEGKFMKKDMLKWYDRKRIWCGLPWTFTKYGMSEDRLFVEKGFFNSQEQEVRLYRILNVNLKRTFFQKIFGLGTIHIDSSDKDLGNFDIINIKKSYDVKELISQTVESERIRNRVTAREYMSDNDDNDSDDHDDHDVSYEFENDSDDDK